MPLKYLLAAACFIFTVTGCGEGGTPRGRVPCPLGERLRNEQLSGIIYSDISTQVTIQRCGSSRIAIAFLGTPDPRFARLSAQAGSLHSVIGFTASADGYLIEEGDKSVTFIVLSINTIEVDPGVAKKAEAVR